LHQLKQRRQQDGTPKHWSPVHSQEYWGCHPVPAEQANGACEGSFFSYFVLFELPILIKINNSSHSQFSEMSELFWSPPLSITLHIGVPGQSGRANQSPAEAARRVPDQSRRANHQSPAEAVERSRRAQQPMKMNIVAHEPSKSYCL
jgi:hypothetical protein